MAGHEPRGWPALYFASFGLLLVSAVVLGVGAAEGVTFSGSYASIVLSLLTLGLAAASLLFRRRR
jgi:hypothetical protein